MRACEPSERNYLIFCEVEFDGQSLREVAARHEISPTRVQQIVEQTRNWFNATTPQWVRERDPARQPFLACRYHHERLSFYLSQMLGAWRASQGEITIKHERPGQLAGVSQTTKTAFGDGRYLLQAARLSQMQIDAAVRLAKIAQKHDLPQVTEIESSTAPTPCAPPAMQQATEVAALTDATEVTDYTVETYDDAGDLLPAAPVEHLVCRNPVRSRVDRKLTRQQRRKAARQRKRETALA